MRKKWLMIMLTMFLAQAAGAALAATPTDTPTLTPTITATPTITLTATISQTFSATPTATEALDVLVSVNHNAFNPKAGQTLEVRNITTQNHQVTVRVFTQEGALVRELVKNEMVPRGTVVAWDGRNQAGQWVASGVYVVVVSGNKLRKRFRVAVIK